MSFRSLKLLCLLSLAVSVLLTALASHANICEGFFNSNSGFISVKENSIKIYDLLKNRQKEFHKKHPKADPLNFPMGKEFDFLVDSIISNLQQRNNETHMSAKKKKRGEKLIEQLDQLKKKGTIYSEYLVKAEEVAEYFEFSEKGSTSELGGSLNYVLQSAKDIFDLTGNFLLPTSEGFNLSEFISSRAVPVYFLEITPVSKRADDQMMSPISFLYHDVNHGRTMSLIDYRTQTKNSVDMTKLNKLAKRMIEDIRTLEKEDRIVVRYFLFSWLHENDGISLYDLFTTKKGLTQLDGQARNLIVTDLDYNKSQYKKAQKIYRDWFKQFIQKNHKSIGSLKQTKTIPSPRSL